MILEALSGSKLWILEKTSLVASYESIFRERELTEDDNDEVSA